MAVGVRSAAAAGGHRLLYSAGDVEIDLQVQTGDLPGDRTLTGQVMSRRGAGGQQCEIELGRGNQRVIGRRSSATGEFTFDHLRAGSLESADLTNKIFDRPLQWPEL